MNWIIILITLMSFFSAKTNDTAVIRINQLGYTPAGLKTAVFGSVAETQVDRFQLVDNETKTPVFSAAAGRRYGEYGPFRQTYRLDFTSFKRPGKYYLEANGTRSPVFTIGSDVYAGTADFCLQYIRQQRCGFNPFLRDSCHTHDGYTLYGAPAGIKDSTHIDVTGGWHDASDYLQYVTTSANATYHLLMAYRDFPGAFGDKKMPNGLNGENNLPDVLDEAKWGLDWLLKMHPADEVMFNQVADDRDHQGMRIPKEDSFYGRGYERPVYFIDGNPQQRGKFLNHTTGTSSAAAKFSSAFSLGSKLFAGIDLPYADSLKRKAASSLAYASKKYGVTQTVSVRAPYIYAEENWTDDMELAFATSLNPPGVHADLRVNLPVSTTEKDILLDSSFRYAGMEPITPWLGSDTASHYQWYPFINVGHYELARQIKGSRRDTLVSYYRQGIEKVWEKAGTNAFYRGVPFIWCSNNLTVAFATQCIWYRTLSGDENFAALEQANLDWLFGCNPWGTSMVYGLPSGGDTPADPHSAFTHLKNYPIDGGLVDGPVYASIYNNLLGITLYDGDEYAAFQSNDFVYHDDYGDYSTNEPTLDGTASLVYLLAAKEATENTFHRKPGRVLYDHGAIIRGDSLQKKITFVFSGDEFAEGGQLIRNILKNKDIKASFFFTGNFFRNPAFKKLIVQLKKDGHYLGPHSDKHLLYCDWQKRDSLLVTKKEFNADLANNLRAMDLIGIDAKKVSYFLPPYEWYNDSIANWTREAGLSLINYTPGTLSHTDYTTIDDKNYRPAEKIFQSIMQKESYNTSGLNGYILLMHIGAGPRRTDKFYNKLSGLIDKLNEKGYKLVRLDETLKSKDEAGDTKNALP